MENQKKQKVNKNVKKCWSNVKKSFFFLFINPQTPPPPSRYFFIFSMKWGNNVDIISAKNIYPCLADNSTEDSKKRKREDKEDKEMFFCDKCLYTGSRTAMYKHRQFVHEG